ncbi:polysaccharide deacetylase family protein [Crocinitomix algicola]|uniref:polysaccharide deacetylase family protein n=1 Tax=Crocinitomix algicola TaxID=1740263 RepID=UPI00083705A8|nr:polysaccharide deacetylase family protein [Crocinitomix algicola]
MRYFKFPKWLRKVYPGAIWDFFIPNTKTIYLTFDDGPNKGTTEWILNLLKQYDAEASFFCLGKNVKKYPKLFDQIVRQGHQIGNHTNNHPNGALTKTSNYIDDVLAAEQLIPSKLFRPPYGKLSPKQYKVLKKKGFKTIFWSHISYDFDREFSSEKRVEKALRLVKNGSIVVFHDSDKAFPQLKGELPYLLETWSKAGYSFSAIPH